MSLADAIVAHVLRLETALYHARARLEAGTDGEALHDLRIAVRRLRSLLRPLHGKEGVVALEQAAAAVGELTTPARDLEVLIEQLRKRGLLAPASSRAARLTASREEILRSPVLQQLFDRLAAWPADLRLAQRQGELRRLDGLLNKRLGKLKVRLQDALADPQHDPHRLRLLVKRNRYAQEAYPQHSPISADGVLALKAVQGALGRWHDRYQWCLRASQEADLKPLREQWKSEAVEALQKAEGKLLLLTDALTAKTKSRRRTKGNL